MVRCLRKVEGVKEGKELSRNKVVEGRRTVRDVGMQVEGKREERNEGKYKVECEEKGR